MDYQRDDRMKKKIFISYADKDKNKMKALSRAINKSKDQLEPLVVAKRYSPNIPLTEKVESAITEADCFIPIITRKSIKNQWVNQEIGFAKAKKKNREIIPIVEKGITPKLKGFIHDKLDLPFTFKGYKSEPNKEASSFRKCYRNTLGYLQNLAAKLYFESSISPTKVKQGDPYTTRVIFRGKVSNGFFDNQVRHSSGWHTWNWDKGTFKGKGKTAPGELHGDVDITREYEHFTRNWPRGMYKIGVGLYDHLVPGEKGRIKVFEEFHDFKVI